MKIGIMGTHGSGKSTFALRMAANLKKECPGDQVGLLCEVVRDCPFPVNEDASREAQLWIYHRQMTAEIEMSARNEILVCDRTALDSIVYAAHAGFLEIVDDYLCAAISWMFSYDELYWLRPAAAPSDDGFRSTDPSFQRKIDEMFSEWIVQYGLVVVTVSLGER